MYDLLMFSMHVTALPEHAGENANRKTNLNLHAGPKQLPWLSNVR
jgi:hypothetical protein